MKFDNQYSILLLHIKSAFMKNLSLEIIKQCHMAEKPFLIGTIFIEL